MKIGQEVLTECYSIDRIGNVFLICEMPYDGFKGRVTDSRKNYQRSNKSERYVFLFQQCFQFKIPVSKSQCQINVKGQSSKLFFMVIAIWDLICHLDFV